MVSIASDMYAEISNFANYCKDGFSHSKKVEGKISNIVLCGMGGSGIAGDFLKAVAPNLRVTVTKTYEIPTSEVGPETLVLVISYSGNTEETLSCLDTAIKKKYRTFAITAGGKLEKVCKAKKIDMIKIPAGKQPRAAAIMIFFSLLKLLENSKVLKIGAAVTETIKLIEENLQKYEEEAKIISQDIARKVPVIYSSYSFAGISYRWKTQINENGKQHAFSNVFSEFNHNEIVGYTLQPENFAVIILKDRLDHPRIKKRMTIFKKLVQEKTKVIEVNSEGKSALARAMSLVLIGDWVSYYVAMMNGQDPTPVDIIEDLKKELKK